MNKPEVGTIVFFDSRRDKRYGFIQPDAGTPDVWFHINDGRLPKAKGGEVIFEDPMFANDIPAVGNRIVFFRAAGKGGKPKACPWAYEDAYTDAQCWADYNAYLAHEKVRDEEIERAEQDYKDLEEQEAREIATAEAWQSELSWLDGVAPHDPAEMTDAIEGDELFWEDEDDWSCDLCWNNPCICDDEFEGGPEDLADTDPVGGYDNDDRFFQPGW